MWLLVLEVLKIRWKWAVGFFVGGGLIGFAANPEAQTMIGSFVPYFSLASVAFVAFGGLLGDEREKRNHLYGSLPLSPHQVILAKIAIPFILISLFLPLGLVAWAVFNWKLSLTAGVISLLGVHSLLVLMLQFLLFWEEFKVYLTDNWFGRILCWLVPVTLGAIFGASLSSGWIGQIHKPALIGAFYGVFVLMALLSYVLFLRRKNYTF